MTQPTKTDNHDPTAKLCLRHYFLRKYHGDGTARVMDCCMGTGFLWRELRKTHKIESYLGLDVKPKKGRLKIDSARYLEAGGWDHNCIDVDTYGCPWHHWFALLANLPYGKATVFLTIGKGLRGLSIISKDSLAAMGLAGFKIPPAIQGRLWGHVFTYCIAASRQQDIEITEAIEATSTGNARYIGMRIEKSKSSIDINRLICDTISRQ